MVCGEWTVFLCLLTGLVMTSAAEPLSSNLKPCCWSDQWEGVLLQKMGTFDRTKNVASLSDMTTLIHVDSTIKMIASNISIFNGVNTVFTTVIEDYNKAESYVISGKHCIKTKFSNPWTAPCVPENAQLIHTGDYAGVKANTWYVSPSEAIPSVRLTVAQDTCLPIHESTVAFGDMSRVNLLLFENVTSGIADPNVFKIPDICLKAQAH